MGQPETKSYSVGDLKEKTQGEAKNLFWRNDKWKLNQFDMTYNTLFHHFSPKLKDLVSSS